MELADDHSRQTFVVVAVPNIQQNPAASANRSNPFCRFANLHGLRRNQALQRTALAQVNYRGFMSPGIVYKNDPAFAALDKILAQA